MKEAGAEITAPSLSPSDEPFLSKFIAVALDFSCSSDDTNRVFCWGDNEDGQLGDGTQIEKSTPVEVGVFNDFIHIAMGIKHVCVHYDTSKLKCWGDNTKGQLGNGSFTSSYSPVEITDVGKIEQIALGGRHTCAILEDDVLKCWGDNEDGQLGDGSNKSKSKSPVKVDVDGNIKEVALGKFHSCALLEDNTLKCWGDNKDSQLGDGTETKKSNTPVSVNVGGEIKQFAVGRSHSCVVLKDDTSKLKCWGDNSKGQLGDGTLTNRNNPTEISVGGDIKQITLGTFHTCALLKDDTLKCWGSNEFGQFGDGSKVQVSIPTKIPADGNIKQIEVGKSHSCFLLENDTLKCSGSNEFGQLGDGTKTQSSYPVRVIK